MPASPSTNEDWERDVFLRRQHSAEPGHEVGLSLVTRWGGAWLRDASSVKLTARELRYRVRLSVESLCLESDGSIECDRILTDVAALHLSRGHEPGS